MCVTIKNINFHQIYIVSVFITRKRESLSPSLPPSLPPSSRTASAMSTFQWNSSSTNCIARYGPPCYEVDRDLGNPHTHRSFLVFVSPPKPAFPLANPSYNILPRSYRIDIYIFLKNYRCIIHLGNLSLEQPRSPNSFAVLFSYLYPLRFLILTLTTAIIPPLVLLL